MCQLLYQKTRLQIHGEDALWLREGANDSPLQALCNIFFELLASLDPLESIFIVLDDVRRHLIPQADDLLYVLGVLKGCTQNPHIRATLKVLVTSPKRLGQPNILDLFEDDVLIPRVHGYGNQGFNVTQWQNKVAKNRSIATTLRLLESLDDGRLASPFTDNGRAREQAPGGVQAEEQDSDSDDIDSKFNYNFNID